MGSIIFHTKAFIGKILTESFFKKFGNRLNAQIFIHKGSVDIEWVKIGDGSKPALVFLHGFSDRKENFYFSAKNLSKNYDIIIPDLPGFGNSTSDPRLVYSLDNYDNWLGEFIEQNHMSRFHLVGNSLGGAIATKLAIKFPDRIKSLSLIDPAGFYLAGKASVYDKALDGTNLFKVETPAEYEKFRGRIFYNRPSLPSYVKEFMTRSAIQNKDWYGKIFNELADIELVKDGVKTIAELSLNAACKEVPVPTNIFWGKQDTLFPYETAECLKTQFIDANVVIFQNTGHCPHLENPKLFAQELNACLEKIE
jgi:pimeloyl-ACP methyl ester carboxylesterase